MKSESFYGTRYLQIATKILAVMLNVALIIAAGIEIGRVFQGLWEMNIALAIQDGLFVLILLEMFYVVRSFVKYGSVNTALIISVGIVALVKEVIFKLQDLDLYTSIAYSVLFLALSIGFMLEQQSHRLKIESRQKPRGIRMVSPEEMQEERFRKSREEELEKAI